MSNKPIESKIQDITLNDGSQGLLFPPNVLFGIMFILFGGMWDLFLVVAMHFSSPAERATNAAGFKSIPLFLIFGSIISFIGFAIIMMKSILVVDSHKIKLIRNFFGREFVKEIENGNNVHVNRVVRYTRNKQPVYGAEIKNESSESIRVGNNLSVEEVSWLKSFIKSKLK